MITHPDSEFSEIKIRAPEVVAVKMLSDFFSKFSRKIDGIMKLLTRSDEVIHKRVNCFLQSSVPVFHNDNTGTNLSSSSRHVFIDEFRIDVLESGHQVIFHPAHVATTEEDGCSGGGCSSSGCRWWW